MTYCRLPPPERKQHILDAAIEAASSIGFSNITRDNVADAANVSPALISHYFYHFTLLKDEVMQHAVDTGVLSVVAEGLLARHAVALAAPQSMRAAAFEHMVGGDAV